MIEVSYLREYEKVKVLPKEVQETIQGILQIIDTEYGAERNKYEDDGGSPSFILFTIRILLFIKLICNNFQNMI